MPWASTKQQAWGNSPTGRAQMGVEKVHEFNEATKGKYGSLPVRVRHKPKLTAFKPKGK